MIDLERAEARDRASRLPLSPERRAEAERFASSLFGSAPVHRLARFDGIPDDIAPHVFAIMCEMERRNGAASERERWLDELDAEKQYLRDVADRQQNNREISDPTQTAARLRDNATAIGAAVERMRNRLNW